MIAPETPRGAVRSREPPPGDSPSTDPVDGAANRYCVTVICPFIPMA